MLLMRVVLELLRLEDASISSRLQYYRGMRQMSLHCGLLGGARQPVAVWLALVSYVTILHVVLERAGGLRDPHALTLVLNLDRLQIVVLVGERLRAAHHMLLLVVAAARFATLTRPFLILDDLACIESAIHRAVLLAAAPVSDPGRRYGLFVLLRYLPRIVLHDHLLPF